MNTGGTLTHRKRDKRGCLLPEPPRRGRGRHGRAFRLIRHRLGWTVPRMAKEFLLSPSTVYGMEAGRNVSRESVGVYVVLARRANLPYIAAVLEAA